MRHHHTRHFIFTSLVVVVGVWGLGYLGLKGIEYLKRPITVNVESLSSQHLNKQEAGITPDYPMPASSSPIRIMIGGDIMLDRSIRALGQSNGYETLFDSKLAPLLANATIAVANLEGPITSHPSKTLVDGQTTQSFTFTFSPKSIAALTTAGIDIVSLANNHTDNFAFLGYRETQDWLDESGIHWFGNPWNSTSTNMSRYPFSEKNSGISTHLTVNGIQVVFVGYHAFQTGVDRVLTEIRRVSGPDIFTIVMPHWGEEYTATSSERMKSLARSFATAGADAIIGAHPHVIMENEWIGPVPVYYSLGNLLFDQYFSEEVMHGLVVELQLEQSTSGPHLKTLKTHDVQLVRNQGAALK